MADTANTRLKYRLRETELSYREIADKTGIPQRTIQNIINEGASIKHEYLQIFYEIFGINPLDILLDDAEKSVHTCGHNPVKEEPAYYNKTDDHEFTTVPFYNIAASAGDGNYLEDREPLPMKFRSYWIKNVMQVSAIDLFLMKVDGDSMEPTFEHGDMILVNRAQKKVVKDNVYVCRMDSLYVVKRIQRIPGNRYRLTSDNELYHPIEADIADNRIEVIGRVCWLSRTQ